MALIFIIDDSTFQRRILAKRLQEAGYETVEATDGLHAMAKLMEYAPDCILCDLLMPRMGGLELLENLSKKSIRIPVIIVTANDQESVRQKCLGLGAYAVVNKPANLDRLVALIQETLDKTGAGTLFRI